MDEKQNLDLVANYVASGTTVLVLGPNFCCGDRTVSDEIVPDFFVFARECCKHFGLDAEDFSSDQEIVDYLTKNRENERRIRLFMRERFGVKRPHKNASILSDLVWRRIYSFDLSDGVEVAYRMNHNRKQNIVSVGPDSPIPRLRAAGRSLELVKLSGDGLSESSHNAFTKPSFKKNVNASKRYNGLRLDFEIHPVIIIGTDSDRDFLFNEFRALRRTEAQQQTVFVCPGMKPHQVEMLSEQAGIYLDIDGREFLAALPKAFPNGRSLDDIAKTTSGFTLKNKALQEIVSDSFTVLTAAKFEELNSAHDIEGGIYSFYKGGHVQWSDVVQGIHADLVPFKNWRNSISVKLEEGFPHANMFLLLSPAGMGKTVGLMAAAYWLRQRTNRPILWLEPDGNLQGFLFRLEERDFADGAFVFVDDTTNFIEAFENISAEKLKNISFVCTSREAKWNRYKKRVSSTISVITQTLRNLNRADAEEIHAKIVKYGTTVHFRSRDLESQIREILERSQRDMLVLIRELGQGRKFDEIIKSEIDDLDQEQRFSYLTVCLTDRNQVPLPMDLFGHAFRSKFPDGDMRSSLDGMGRIIEITANRRTIRTRHSIIAQHIVEQRNAVVAKREIEQAVRALITAFSNYQIPILVHHSNTGHARVFKTIMNRGFLSKILGVQPALDIYRNFEKTFELDGFFWQQYGLCQSQAGMYEQAVETLRHAYAIHEHFLIKHSLGATSLTACAKLGPDGLQGNEFGALRANGQQLLIELHDESGYKDDLAIATLAEIDTDISKKFDESDEFRNLCEKYHRMLAFYIRDHPEMQAAKQVYEKLNGLLLKASFIEDPDYDALLENVSGGP